MSRSTGYLLAFLCAASTGGGAVLGKLAREGLSGLNLSLWIFVVAAPAAGVYMVAVARQSPVALDRRGSLLLSAHIATSCAAIWLFFEGLGGLDPTLASFVNRIETIGAVILGVILLGERFRRVEALAAGVAVAGVVLMELSARGSGEGGGTAFSMVLAASLLFAVTEYFAKLAVRRVPASVIAFYRSCALAALFGLLAALTGDLAVPRGEMVPLVLGVALLGPVAGRILYLTALGVLELSRVAVIAQTQPLFAAPLAFLLVGAVPGPLGWAGGLLVLLACVVLVRARRDPR